MLSNTLCFGLLFAKYYLIQCGLRTFGLYFSKKTCKKYRIGQDKWFVKCQIKDEALACNLPNIILFSVGLELFIYRYIFLNLVLEMKKHAKNIVKVTIRDW